VNHEVQPNLDLAYLSQPQDRFSMTLATYGRALRQVILETISNPGSLHRRERGETSEKANYDVSLRFCIIIIAGSYKTDCLRSTVAIFFARMQEQFILQ
jgi:hypothetical protein